jgi:hypothetical protein
MLRATLIVALLAGGAGCASTEGRDEFVDKRAEFRRAAIACGSNTDCLRNVKEAKKNSSQ